MQILYALVDMLWALVSQNTVFSMHYVLNEAVESVWKDQQAHGDVNHVLRFKPKPYYTVDTRSNRVCLHLTVLPIRTHCVQPSIFLHPENQTRR
jgi:hypothetical protein